MLHYCEEIHHSARFFCLVPKASITLSMMAWEEWRSGSWTVQYRERGLAT